MLAPGNYVQWKSRIKRYIDTKPNSELIYHCLQNLPYTYQWAEKTVPVAEGLDTIYTPQLSSSEHGKCGKPLDRLETRCIVAITSDLQAPSSIIKLKRFEFILCSSWRVASYWKIHKDIRVKVYTKDIYTLINHFTDAKDIWDNVKMILEGYEFTYLINDMRNIKMTMSRMQLNSKFVNNMLPEWSRFITEVKLNRGLKESNFDQLYAYLKQHEVHANENRMMMERFIQPTNDPLALVSNASVQQYPTQSSMSPQSSNEPSPAPVDNFQLHLGSSSTEYLIESLTNTLALLNQSFKVHLPQMNNQLRTSSNVRNNATVQDGRVVVQDVRG
ncbi:hypothetical protein Tco_0576307, partial [Tanacetum coccineum]